MAVLVTDKILSVWEPVAVAGFLIMTNKYYLCSQKGDEQDLLLLHFLLYLADFHTGLGGQPHESACSPITTKIHGQIENQTSIIHSSKASAATAAGPTVTLVL